MIFIPTPKLVVDCFTYNGNAFELFPIDHAIKFFPDWWKQMPKETEVHGFIPVSTMKRCTGIHDVYKNGIILPLWADLAMRFENGKWDLQFADNQTVITPHSPEQWKYYADPVRFTHIKIESPWVLHTKKPINWVYMRPMWNLPIDTPLNIVSGILNFRYQHNTHINMFLPSHPTKEIILAGQPMAHIIPQSEKEIVLKHHYVTEQEYFHKYTARTVHSFVRGYQRAVAIRKNIKCPFHK